MGILLRCCVCVTEGNPVHIRESYNATGLRRLFHSRPLVDTDQNDGRGAGSCGVNTSMGSSCRFAGSSGYLKRTRAKQINASPGGARMSAGLGAAPASPALQLVRVL